MGTPTKTQMLRGKLEALGVIEVLSHVARTRETGLLKVQRDDIEKAIVIHEGDIVFARSNLVDDRLGDMLLNQGVITEEQYDSATVLLKEKGYRHGRSLVEIGAITPKTLWRAIQDQIRQIAYSVIPMPDGSFEFVRQSLKQKEQITLSLPVMNLLVDVIRHYDERTIFRNKFADSNAVLGHTNLTEMPVDLEPYEEYVMERLDGSTSIGELCEVSDIGTDETLRVLFLLKTLGVIEEIAFKDATDDHVLAPVIAKYNGMYRQINSYLGEHLGSVGGSLMRKYLDEARGAYEGVLGGVRMGKDGSLSSAQIYANVETLGHEDAQAIQVTEEALSEFLYACILAVKRALGTEHETAVVEQLEANV